MEPRYDPMTDEYFFAGRWYDTYPKEAIEAHEEHLIEQYELEQEEKKAVL